jgi:hypothetical protein
MTQAEEIYHRFVQYEWNEISDSMKKSIIDAINEALLKPDNSEVELPLTEEEIWDKIDWDMQQWGMGQGECESLISDWKHRYKIVLRI